jgi:branched-subunit amino acid transport protein AzlD
MGAVVIFCRAFPCLFFREAPPPGSPKRAFLRFVEKIAPPAAMTVLAVNAVAGNVIGESLRHGAPALIAAVFTALLHLWKRNSLVSIFGGTALYMVLRRIIMQ